MKRGKYMIGVAVLGVGGWGQNHARVLSQLRGEEIVSDVLIVDIDEKRAKTIARRFGHEWTTSYEEALKRDNIDAIIIATPTRLHYQHALMALEYDKHILVEKPLTETVEQALKVIRIAGDKKRLVMVGFLLRFSPAILKAREYYMENKIGKILTILAKRTSYWPNRPMDVGVVRDLAIHDIDLIRFITNLEPKYVLAKGGALKHDYEDYASLFIEYGTDTESELVHALLEVNWVTPFKIRRMEITGDEGVLLIDLLEHKVSLLREEGIHTPNIPRTEPLYMEDRNFVLSIEGKEKPLITAYDGITALKTCEKALLSMQKGTIEKVE